MKYALVGNNDGPLRLLKAVQDAGLQLPVFVGLQKTPNARLFKEYQEQVGDIPLKTSFEETGLISLLKPKKPDLIINCFCNFKFTKLLEKYHCYNVHPSHLPKYRGRHPLHWALINGEKKHGITVHEMSKNYDDGPIIWQENVSLNENMSVAELRERLVQNLENAFPQILTEILTEKAEKRPNTAKKSTYIKRRSPEDSKLCEWHDAGLIYRKIKALRSEDHPAFLPLKENRKLPIFDVKRAEKSVFPNEKSHPSLLKIEGNALLIKTEDKQLLWLFSAENVPHQLKIDFTT